MTVFNEWKSKKIQGKKNNFGFVIFLFFFALFFQKNRLLLETKVS